MSIGNSIDVERQEREEADNHDFAIRKLYKELYNHGYTKEDAQLTVKALVKMAGEVSLSRLYTDQIEAMYKFVSLCHNELDELLKSLKVIK